MNNMNEQIGHDYITHPSFRLLTELELQDRARKDSSLICIAAGCEETRYQDFGPNGIHFWVICAKHREKFLQSMGQLSDSGFSQMVTNEFKRKLKFDTKYPCLIEEITLVELLRREPRRGI